MHLGVLGAFLSASATSFRASRDCGTQYLVVASGSTERNRPRGGAEVSAIQVFADARGQFADHLLRQAGIGATGAYQRTGLAFLNAAQQRLINTSLNPGMS